MDSRPVFISVLYRSGSTLLTLILNQSEELKISYDIIHFMRFSYGKYLPIENRYKQLVKDTKNRIMKRWKLNLNDDEIARYIGKHERVTEAIVYDEEMKSFLNLKENQRWGDRSAVKWEGILPFLEMFPQGKSIHIYRDPRAVLASYKYFTYHPGLMYLDAIFASLAMFNFIEQENIVQHERIYLLKYEDLVFYPNKTIKEICNFLEIKFTEKMLDVTSFEDNFGQPFDANSIFTGPRKKIDTSTVNLWKEKLSRIETYLTEMILKDKLRKHGFGLSGADLTKEEFCEMYEMLHSDFLYKRYKYWLKNAEGVEAYPDDKDAYLER